MHATTEVLLFGVLLLIAVLLSERASRTMLSGAVLFLLAGMALGWMGVVSTEPVEFGGWIEVVLAGVLLTDGLHLQPRSLRRRWPSPVLALGLGLPITVLLVGLAARLLAGLPWVEAFLLGAVLAPTDPLLSSGFVGDERVPKRLRDLINAESGLNDGLALPLVLVLLDLARARVSDLGGLLLEILVGVAIGAAVAWIAVRLEQSRFLGAHPSSRSLLPVAVGIVVWGMCAPLHGNVFLGEFVAGMTIAGLSPETARSFGDIGDAVVEVAKLAVLMMFGALFSGIVPTLGAADFALAAVVLLAIRPLAVAPLADRLTRRGFAAVAWLGPRGISSVFYALLVLQALGGDGYRIYALALLIVACSIVVHGSTDVLVARFVAEGPQEEPTVG